MPIPYFGGQSFGNVNKTVKFTGIDRDVKSIEKAKYLCAYTSPSARMQFIVGNATNLDSCFQERSPASIKADVIVMRHPNVYNANEPWQEIIKESIRVLRADGIFFGTTFIDYEQRELRKILEDNHCEIVVVAENPFSQKLTDLLKVDSWVVIARKRGEIHSSTEPLA